MADTYTTLQGDTWDTVAYRLWGREAMMNHLIAANPEHGDTLMFSPDIVLRVPKVAVPSKTPDLPPWMKGGGHE